MPTTQRSAFGIRVAAMRHHRAVSARWVGREAGISSAMMTHIEQGRSVPSSEILSRLADVFGVTMDELWRGVGRCDFDSGASPGNTDT